MSSPARRVPQLWRRPFRRRIRSPAAAPAGPPPRAGAVSAPRRAPARNRAPARRDSSLRRATARRRTAERFSSAGVRHRRAPFASESRASASARSPRRRARSPASRCERPAGGVRSAARPFDKHRPEPGQATDQSAQALALASEVGARRMAGEAPRQSRRAQRPLVDGAAHARGQRLRHAVEALARLSDDRLATGQRAGKRPEVGAKSDGEAAGSRRGCGRSRSTVAARSSARTGTANSAAAVGVGARRSAA